MKKFLKPFFLPLYNLSVRLWRKIKIPSNQQAVFSRIFVNREWGKANSVSGYGSTIEATERIRKELPELFRRHNIRTMIDAPCGDCYWTKEIITSLEQYIGVDIVPDIIELNRKNFDDSVASFEVLDVSSDKLPKSDCIMVRDLFIHFPSELIFKSIVNILNSNIKYLLLSNYPQITNYKEINVGGCRSVNLLAKPFYLPEPIEVVEESWEGKNLSLWDSETLKKELCKTNEWRQLLGAYPA